MRLIALAAATLLAILPVMAAQAQPGHHGPGAHRGDHRGPALHNRGGGRRHVVRRHRTCRTVWRNHHRERRCY